MKQMWEIFSFIMQTLGAIALAVLAIAAIALLAGLFFKIILWMIK